MNGDIDGAAHAMHPMPGLLDDTKDLVTRSEFGTLVPQLEIRSAQRGSGNSHQHFARIDVGNPNPLDGDVLVAMKYSRFHGVVGSIDGCHFDTCH
jgi:hypothetical protein